MKQKMVAGLLSATIITLVSANFISEPTDIPVKVLGSMVSTASASQKQPDVSELKVMTLQDMYEEAFNASELDDTYNSLLSIYKYSSNDFQRSLRNGNKYANDDDGMVTTCGEQYYSLHLDSGDFFLSEASPHDVKYSKLDDGDIRVVIETKEFGDSVTKDYSLDCDAGGCQITDIYSHNPFQGEKGYASENIAKYCY